MDQQPTQVEICGKKPFCTIGTESASIDRLEVSKNLRCDVARSCVQACMGLERGGEELPLEGSLIGRRARPEGSAPENSVIDVASLQ